MRTTALTPSSTAPRAPRTRQSTSGGCLRLAVGLAIVASCSGPPPSVELAQTPRLVKHAPWQVWVESSAATPSSTSPAAPWALFDRDATVGWIPAPGTTDVVVDFAEQLTLSHVKVFGNPGATLRIGAGVNEWFAEVDLSHQGAGWHAIALTQAMDVRSLTLQWLTPTGAGDVGVVGEVEFWGMADQAPQRIEAATWATEPLPPSVDSFASSTAEIELTAGAADTRCGVFSVDLGRPPQGYRRTWLVYETEQVFRPFVLSRSVNGSGIKQAHRWLPQQGSATFVDAIDPDILRPGNNDVEFCLHDTGTEAAVVRDLRLVAEPDWGANIVDAATVGAATQGFVGDTNAAGVIDGREDTSVQVAAGARLSIGLAHTVSPDQVRFTGEWDPADDWQVACLVGGDRRGDLPMSVASQWMPIDVEANTTVPGLMTLTIAEPARLQCAAIGLVPRSDAVVREIEVIGSGAGHRVDWPRITLASPREHFGRMAWVDGWVALPPAHTGPIYVAVDGEYLPAADGVFARALRRVSAAKDVPWEVTVTAQPEGEAPVSRTFVLGDNARNAYQQAQDSIVKPDPDANPSADELQRYGAVDQEASQHVRAGEAAQVSLGTHVKVTLAADTLTIDGVVSLRHLDQRAVPTLPPWLVNVTAPRRHGYAVQSTQPFGEPVQVEVPFAAELIPAGQSPTDVHTFTYDASQNKWRKLARNTVQRATSTVTSQTNESGTLINATVVVPEHPQLAQFTPTQLSDIAAADPGAQINHVPAPQGGPMGDATTGYPIDLPPGRQGFAPSLSIQYSSGRGNGWLGIGWDVSVPAIEVDTRWGVPRYQANLESETYSFGGEQLAPVAHRAAFVARTADRVFHPRVEGSFARIVRHGGHPSQYWWEVTDKSGMRYFYGGTPTDDRPLPDATLTDDSGNVFHWALVQMRDLRGNAVHYQYDRVTTSTPEIAAGGTELYLKKIRYTGRVGTPGPYEVEFLRDSHISAPARPDVRIDARGGFKRVTADRLRRIEVRLQGDRIRRYDLDYTIGAFSKSLLAMITQYGADGQPFPGNQHRFHYFDEIPYAAGSYSGFGPRESWDPGDDNVNVGVIAGAIDIGRASALGGSKTDTTGGHLYVGYNALRMSKSGSAGGKVGTVRTRSRGLLSMLDINGDGLLDKVFAKSGIHYRVNQSGAEGEPGTETQFGARQPIAGLAALSDERSSTGSFGAEEYVFANLIDNYAHTFATTSTYFSDVNSDGFVDQVRGGTVWFGYLDDSGAPTFSINSADTPVPVAPGLVDGAGALGDLEPLRQQLIDEFPRQDALRRWRAPYNGTIRITAPVSLAPETRDARAHSKVADGVQVAIQKNGTELWTQRITATNNTVFTPTGVDAIEVDAGDRIYFRVQSHYDGTLDEVVWDPQIQYVGQSTTVRDVNGLLMYRFGASQDFVTVGWPQSAMAMPYAGRVRIVGAVTKHAVTTDDVTVQVIQQYGTNEQRVAFSQTLAWNHAGDIEISEEFTVDEGEPVLLHVKVDSPIDAQQVTWQPQLVYVAIDAANPPPIFDSNGDHAIVLPAQYDQDLYATSRTDTPHNPYKVPRSGTLYVRPSVATWWFPLRGELYFTVKRRGALDAKQRIEVDRSGATTEMLELDVSEGDKLYFSFSIADPTMVFRVKQASVKVWFSGSQPTTAPSQAYQVELHTNPTPVFPQPYRGWGAAGYRGERDAATTPIDEHALTLPDSEAQPSELTAYPYVASPHDRRWVAPDKLAWVTGHRMHSSRLGLATLPLPRPGDLVGTRAVSRLAYTGQNTIAISVGSLSGSFTAPPATTRSKLDYLDLNGDGFPDIASARGVQYSTPNGGLEPNARGDLSADAVRKSKHSARNIGIGGNAAWTRSGGDGKVGASGQSSGKGSHTSSQMVTLGLGISAGIGSGDSNTVSDLVDINGDGLPDRLTTISGDIHVALNLGYQFAAPVRWGAGAVNTNESETINGGASGFNDGVYGWGGGVSVSTSTSTAQQTLVDINGDGLVDRVWSANGSLRVALNTGHKFAAPTTWAGGFRSQVSKNSTTQTGGGLYITVGFPTCLFACWVIINPGADTSRSIGRPEVMLADIDGDGYVDQLASSRDDQLSVARSRVGRTHLLRAIERPLGSRTELAYRRMGNTVKQPRSRWVLSEVRTFDGVADDAPSPALTADYQVTRYDYEGGVWDRLERAFYGFETVTETELNTLGVAAADLSTAPPYRSATRTFRTDSYYAKGLLETERVEDVQDPAQARPLSETTHSYVFRDVASGAPGDPTSTTAVLFAELVRTDQVVFEGDASAALHTYMTYGYDALGNVVEYVDAGDVGDADDVRAKISYTGASNGQHRNCASRHIVGSPERIVVVDHGDRIVRQRTAGFNCETGELTAVRQWAGGSQWAMTELTYDDRGNLTRVVGPANERGQRYALSYDYDPDVHTHVARIKDSFGYVSHASYDLRFGAVTSTLDPNGNAMHYSYDAFGRVSTILGPLEDGRHPYSLRFAYHPTAPVPYARTEHIDGERAVNDPIETLVFTDGLGRTLQTKLDSTVYRGQHATALDVMVVSGRTVFDHAGRTIEGYHPVVETKGANNATFSPGYDSVRPTRITYDARDRAVVTTLPDQTVSRAEYAIGPDARGQLRAIHSAIDANGNRARAYRNVRDQTTSVHELNGPQTYVTTYAYDPLSQLHRVTDAQGNVTHTSYDALGRRVSIDNADTGHTTYRYDLASNLTHKVTANLRAQGKSIRYRYRFNRLAAIDYPNHPQNNVRYQYGAPLTAGQRDPLHRAGRVRRVRDGSGIHERGYDALGQLVREAKTVWLHGDDEDGAGGDDDDPPTPHTFVTRYRYDSWGRLRELHYPDGEQLVYRYDAGGRVRAIDGAKQGNRYPYVTRYEYDHFGQAAFVKLGNGNQTEYHHEPQLRRMVNVQTRQLGGHQRTFQNTRIGYDPVGNILSLQNRVPDAFGLGGPVTQNFRYDGLYRLTRAAGRFASRCDDDDDECDDDDGDPGDPGDPEDGHETRYTLDLSYDSIHNIRRKTQQHVVRDDDDDPGDPPELVERTSYDFAYRFDGPQPHAPTHIGTRRFAYDLNGNLVRVIRPDDDDLPGDDDDIRRLFWDEENRLHAVSDDDEDGGDSSSEDDDDLIRYVYNDAGQRIIKRADDTEIAYINSYFTVRSGDHDDEDPVLTKHIWIGSRRLLSKLVPTGDLDDLPPGDEPDPGDDDDPPPPSASELPRTLPEDFFIFYYHPDHLGTTSYVTDRDGQLVEHLQYFPFGETWIHQSRHDDDDSLIPLAYRFTGKQLDPETGYYYFGARYYDPRTSVWLSTDPILASYLDGSPNAGVFNAFNLALYTYSYSNPINLRDPDGRGAFDWAKGVVVGIGSAAKNAGVGIYNSVRHPIRTATAIGSAIRHPIRTVKAIGGDLVATAKAIASGDPEAIGGALFDVAAMLVGGGALSKVGKAVKKRAAARGGGSFGRNTVGAAEAAIPKFTRAMKSQAEIIAKGNKIRKVQTLVEKFGGKAKNWKKMKTWDANGSEIHWYEHPGIGKVGEKWSGFPDPF